MVNIIKLAWFDYFKIKLLLSSVDCAVKLDGAIVKSRGNTTQTIWTRIYQSSKSERKIWKRLKNVKKQWAKTWTKRPKMKKMKFNKTSSLLFLIETFYYILCPFINKKLPKPKSCWCWSFKSHSYDFEIIYSLTNQHFVREKTAAASQIKAIWKR